MKLSLLCAALPPCVLVFSSVLTGCNAPRPRPEAPPVAVQQEESGELPPWFEEPFSAEKMKHIEQWLAEQDSSRRGMWQIEGELQLQAGAVELARRDLAQDKSKAKSQSVGASLRSARAALEKLAQDPAANEGQQKRSQDAEVRAERLLADLGPQQPALGIPVIARASWGALPARPALMTKNSGGWNKITVHHSAEVHPVPLDGSQKSSAAAMRQIQFSHLKSKQPPWGDIGYHFLIDPEGRVFQGRDLAWQGAHAKGDNNIQNLGICLLGNFNEERPSPAALESLRKLLDNLRKTWHIPRGEVHAHSEFRSTDCPGKWLKPWVDEYQSGGSPKPLAEKSAARKPK